MQKNTNYSTISNSSVLNYPDKHLCAVLKADS